MEIATGNVTLPFLNRIETIILNEWIILKLAELNIVGFKSFAKKTNVVFHEGMTAVVGPNGCGKSNIVDAIRWVMGEQRSSALRSEKMDNVIFSGSASAKPVGMAEVSLRIDNEDHTLPVDYSEVLITRRLFRSGESQYLINGNQCRLKDIADLFMDTGLTGQSYSVIELAQVEKILNGQAEERRRIFEEAAGITKFKQRRRLTYRKLEATQKDLLRVEDILSEVDKKVRGLKRQVSKAKRYQELSDELKDLDIRLATFDYRNLLNELDPLETKLYADLDEREKTGADLAAHDAAYEKLKTRLLELERQLSEEQNSYNNIAKNIQKFEERVLVNKERIRSLEEMQKRYANERQNLVDQLGELEQEHDEATHQNKQAKKDLEQARAEYDSLNEEYQKFRDIFNEKRTAVKNNEAEILFITEELSKKMNEGERLRAREENLSQRLEEINSRVEDQKKQLNDLENKISDVNEKESALATELEEKKKQQANAAREAQEAGGAAEGLRKTDLQDQNHIEVLENNAEMIRKVLENYQDYPPGVRYLATLNSDNFTSYGTVANILHVNQQHRLAVSAALGEAATYLLVRNKNDAYSGIGLLQQERKGVASFLPLEHGARQNPDHPDVDDLGVVDWANKIITCDDKFRSVIDYLLGSYLIVQDLETANRIYNATSEQNFNLVTLNGEVLGHWGLIRGGSHSKRQSDFIGRQEELEELQNEIKNLKEKCNQRQSTITEREQQEKLAAEQSEALLQEINALDESLSKTRMELGQLDYEKQSLKNSIDQQIEEKKQLLDRVSQLGENLKSQDSDAQSLKTKRNEISEKNKELEKELEKAEEDMLAASQKVQKKEVKLAELSSEFNSAQRHCDSVREQMNATRRMIEQRDEESDRATKEIEELFQVNEEYEERIKELQETLKKLQDKLDSLKDEQYQVNVKTDEQEKQIRAIRQHNEQLSQNIHESQLRISELKMRIDSLEKRMQEEYEYELKRIPADPDLDVDESRTRARELREQLKKMGPVNLLALKEYQQEKERYDFLNSQRNDLLKAQKDLNETIEIINKTAQEKFYKTFEQVQANFSKVFKSFFQGGRASLVLRESDDPLEADIDIFAAPGGKKPASLQLLSGGEKSLTAVSLLFAIYLVKPSPFCIFDEVDAPLDDKNVQRFTTALSDFAKDTQFILVTHNKLTMRAANQLYGVTMEEEGVSKVVSVKFETAEQYAN